MMGSDRSTPPSSREASIAAKRNSPPLSLDLSDLPPLVSPSPPSNTLLVTNLHHPEIFAPTTLAHLRDLISKHIPDEIHTFSPLRSLRRIIITFHSIDSAMIVRSLLDGESLFDCQVRVYFGEPTPIETGDQHLQAPKAEKQFLISPPPSPPHGWEAKEEDPPNKDVHAEDLTAALEKLSANRGPAPVSPASGSEGGRGRQRSGSVIVFDPVDQGHDPDLPAIAVEDTTESPDPMTPSEEGSSKRIIAHTSRPPMELMMVDS